MIRLIVVVLVASLAWMAWWGFGQVAYEKGLSAWVEDRQRDGWVAEYSELNTVGFPNRFDTTLTDLNLADPETGVAWSAPMVQILSLAYKPHQVIAVLPPGHVFSTPLEKLTFAHEDARASLFLRPTPSLALDRARFVAEELEIASDVGWTVALSEGRFAFEAVPAAENTYRLGAELVDLQPAEAARRLLDPGGLLPESVETMRVDADLRFDRPWDRHAVEDLRPQFTEIDLKDLSARWGRVTFRAAGEVTVNPQGVPDGQVTLRAVEWRKLLAMAHSAGLLPTNLVGPVENALELMSGRTDTLDATLTFRGGTTWLGLVPLGPAPNLTLR
ncbi:MAG: DUF2125 domain-containing protein [Pseudomonadota bacterium]